MTRATLTHRIAMGMMLVVAGSSSCGCGISGYPADYLPVPTKPVPTIPSISATALVRAVQGYEVSVYVKATGAVTLEADLSGLPPGNDARFVAIPGESYKRLTWTPTVNDRGFFAVFYIATNKVGTNRGETRIYVAEHVEDAPPVVTGPAEVHGRTGTTFSFDFHAEDPDGDPIFGWSSYSSGRSVGGRLDRSSPGSFETARITCRFDHPDTFDVIATAYNFLEGSDTTRVMISDPE